MSATAVHTASVPLPPARGPLSAAVREVLLGGTAPRVSPGDADPLGEDLQLALYLAYEPHYRSLSGVAGEREWDPALLGLRQPLEQAFLAALRAAVPAGEDGAGGDPAALVAAAVDPLLVEPVDGHGVSHRLVSDGDWRMMREYLAHRSVYQLKESDPQAWLIPRLEGRAKAALVAVAFDEFGGGRAERVHARLFAELMAGAGLDPAYNRYLELVPATALATVNVMSLFGLHRRLRGAAAGNFAVIEITSPPGARRMARALERLGAGERCTRFFTEHIEADAVHEQVMRREVLGGLIAGEPELAPDVAFGVRATVWLDDRWAEAVLAAWDAGRTSLLAPLPSPPARLPEG
ncbi:iron-containing redox enzyme family protein [Streptomyces sp. LP05-1]|uniref:Iron-containing redox enzyme family protein n=1 Tax=Streptomyces pyxinae TaxID=2970734 RepID=A0ABT2CH81_9ACTN|nr:iron-containing redox enzyme family protein [Streptomyces sp. LP05-1]MCS0636764.1 iron-containing redox enzyme family protein [Streptomyces sp. LP05-1]